MVPNTRTASTETNRALNHRPGPAAMAPEPWPSAYAARRQPARIAFGVQPTARWSASPMTDTPKTWHYGLVAKWWAEFNQDGPEIAYFQKYVERGQPALDVACGTGRLLIPFLRAGLDVDGCDVSPDMIALCREKATLEGLSPTLSVQAMHELDPPRTYRTIFVCGAFGLGSTRDQDLQSLSRFHKHLEPGG